MTPSYLSDLSLRSLSASRQGDDTEFLNMFRDFAKFLKEFNIVSLAIAFVMGSASTALVNSLVKDIVMPLLAPLLSGDEWRSAVLQLGPINLPYGSFLAELINFLILAFVVFFVATKLLKMESVPKK